MDNLLAAGPVGNGALLNFIANETPQKLRGGYYTDPVVARFLVRWVAGIAPRRVLEPSCGDGALLRALAAERLDALAQVVACELDPGEAAAARVAAEGIEGARTTVHERDFLGWALDALDQPPGFDAVVGNPPFIRYQYLDAPQQERAERLIRHFGLPFTRHTNAWVPFVVGALSRLRAGGRLAMVVPAELLHVLHARSVRELLIRECSRVLVLDPAELWFEGTLQGVVLLLAEKGAGPAEVAITRIGGREALSAPSELFEQASYVRGASLPGKWMRALLSPRERQVLSHVEALPGVARFDQVASVSVGIVTGANRFFLVPDAVVEAHGLQAFAHPMFGRSEHVPGVLYDRAVHEENRRRGLPTSFLWFDGVARDDLPPGALRYVEAGEAEGLDRRYKCRIRTPWYTVPSVSAAPVGMLKRCHDHPRLVLNTLGAYTTDTAYRVAPRIPAPLLVASFVNSLTALSAELEGRHYGGGVLELVPSEIDRLLIPVPSGLSSDLVDLDRSVRAGLDPQRLLAERDAVVLGALDLGAGEREELQQAWWRLRSRRQRRG